MADHAQLTSRQIRWFSDLLSQPTAPFREHHVKRWIIDRLTAAGVPFFEDGVGNIVSGVASEANYQRLLRARSSPPVPIFIAHMDHPGFMGLRWVDDRHLSAHWFGGSPTKHLRGARLWIADDSGYWGEGTIQQHALAKHGFGLESVTLKLTQWPRDGRRPAAESLFGGFGFRAPVWRQGQVIYTKAADDLAGVFCALETLIGLAKKKAAPVLALFTRAEEVGFVGAIGHFEQYRLRGAQHALFAVSLEASRTLPGAVVGHGPIVRLGDRRSVFNPDGSQFLTRLAEKTLGKSFQRRIMDGGACEGTAATAYGIPTMAMSVPLGNYHNQGFEGGPDCAKPNGPAPEFVHLGDVAGMLALCRRVAQQPSKLADDPWRETRVRLVKNYKSLKKHL